jgi:heterodisulfide reductase subunit A-like polyferredoxin
LSAKSIATLATKSTSMTNAAKKTVLVIGGGAVGAIAALNLDVGGLAEVFFDQTTKPCNNLATTLKVAIMVP